MSQSSILWLINSALILGIFYWSGTASEQVIYDKHPSRLDALAFSVTDYNAAATFYRDVLNFEVEDTKAEGPVQVNLPGEHRIVLQENSASDPKLGPSHLRLSVRTGFETLHRILSGRAKERGFSESISPILGAGAKRSFLASDPSGNKIEFVPRSSS